jgi:hypothetical protein
MVDEEDQIFTRYARLWAFVTMSIAAALGIFLTLSAVLFRISSSTGTALAAVGESIIASVFLYVLVSLFLDPVRQRSQARQLAGYAISVANSEFKRRFEASLPEAVFESTATLSPAFKVAFSDLLSRSRRYDVKGSTARFATYRLAKLAHRREFQQLDQ